MLHGFLERISAPTGSTVSEFSKTHNRPPAAFVRSRSSSGPDAAIRASTAEYTFALSRAGARAPAGSPAASATRSNHRSSAMPLLLQPELLESRTRARER